MDPWTAVQAYNFGKAYIDYVADNGGVNTVELAKAYSKNVVAPSLGNTSGQTYTYYQPVAMYYGGGKLYTNGGNIYYAKEVQFNLFFDAYVLTPLRVRMLNLGKTNEKHY